MPPNRGAQPSCDPPPKLNVHSSPRSVLRACQRSTKPVGEAVDKDRARAETSVEHFRGRFRRARPSPSPRPLRGEGMVATLSAGTAATPSARGGSDPLSLGEGKGQGEGGIEFTNSLAGEDRRARPRAMED